MIKKHIFNSCFIVFFARVFQSGLIVCVSCEDVSGD